MKALHRPTTPLPDETEVLFEEAHRRRRRRRLAVGTVVVALAVLGAGVFLLVHQGGGGGTGRASGATSSGGHHGATGTAGSPQGTTTTVVLPRGYWFDQITTENGHLLLTGYVATASDLAVPTRCAVAPLDDRTLAVGKVTVGSCDSPAMSGRTVAPVISSPVGAAYGTVAIARLEGRSGAVSTGPVVMTFTDTSDTRPIVAYGGGSIWIYDVHTTRGAEAVECSATTGHVERTVSTPPLVDPLVAADDDGLWLGNSTRGTALPDVVYHAAPGAPEASGILSSGHGHAWWMRASGDQAWIGVGPEPASETIWRFDGPRARVGLRVREAGFDPVGTVVGDDANGLWTVVPYPPFGLRVTASANKHEDVIRIDPDTGAEQLMAQQPPLPTLLAEEHLAQGEATVFGGSFFVLEPPFEAKGYLGFSRLVRVVPPAGTP